MADKYCNGPFLDFYCWDYSELLWAWNMNCSDEDGYNLSQIKYVIDHCYNRIKLINNFNHKRTFFQKKAILDMRRFIKILSKQRIGGYYAPFWKGISNIKNDDVFLQMLHPVIGHAWT